MSAERALIEAFVIPERRARYAAFLESARGREKFRRELAHFRHFDKRFVEPVPTSRQTPEDIYRMLVERGAGERCSVISESARLDGQELSLRAALVEVVGAQQGTILYTLTGPVAYYEGEEPGDRIILKRTR